MTDPVDDDKEVDGWLYPAQDPEPEQDWNLASEEVRALKTRLSNLEGIIYQLEREKRDEYYNRIWPQTQGLRHQGYYRGYN